MATPDFTNIASPEAKPKIDTSNIEISARGVVYYKQSQDNADDEEAANEHARVKLSLFIPMSEVQKRFGIGTRLYFNFVKFAMLTNLILGAFSLIHYIIFLARRPSGSRFEVRDLFISSYSEDEYRAWLGINVVVIIVWFSFPAFYFLYIYFHLAKQAAPDHDNIFALSGMEVDIIKENAHFTSTQRFWRRIITYFIFVVLILMSGGITYGIQYAGSKDASKVFSIINWVVTGSVILVNLFFQKICIALVQLEKHQTWSQFRKHHTIKLLSFKMTNVSAMYFALNFAFQPEDSGCVFQDTGSKFLTLMLLDVTMGNIIELIVPYVNRFMFTHVPCIKKTGGDEDLRPDFDVAEDYLEIFYRQFVVYLGISVFPLLPFLGLFNNLVEYWLDKYRMLRVCKKPKPLDLTMKRWLVVWLCIIGVAGLVSWPQGAAYILSAKHRSNPAFKCCRILGRYEVNNCTIIN